MRFSITGRRRPRPQAPAEPTPVGPQPAPLITARVSTGGTTFPRSFGRRDIDFAFDRVFIPSLVIDHTELFLRQAGVCGEEGFVLWAGALAGGAGHVSSVVVPRISTGAVHGEVSVETTAQILDALDRRDLVPIAQLHTHPHAAFLSETDAIRPVVAVPGFLSIVIPDFGFVDLAEPERWSAHEFRGAGQWQELVQEEKTRRFVIDDSIIRVGR